MKTIMRMRSKMYLDAGCFHWPEVCLAVSALLCLRGWGKGFPVGIQLYTVSAYLAKDPAGTLKNKIAQIGYNEVQPAFG